MKEFTGFLKFVKFPNGLDGNLKKNINTDGWVTGLKTVDLHVIIVELGNSFKLICSRTLRVKDLEKAQDAIIKILCKLEIIFAPTFFTIMVHVTMHLPKEALEGGCTHSRDTWKR